jgi:transposase
MRKRERNLNRQYTDEFKLEAVRLSESLGGNDAAKRLGIPESTLWNWIKLSRAGELKADHDGTLAVKRSITQVAADNARLRRELASAKLDLEIVKKAAAYFAKEEQSEGCRGEVRLDPNALRPVQRGTYVSPARCIAHGLLPVDNTRTQSSRNGQCSARCTGGRAARGQSTQLRAPTYRARTAQTRCSCRPRTGAQELKAPRPAPGVQTPLSRNDRFCPSQTNRTQRAGSAL